MASIINDKRLEFLPYIWSTYNYSNIIYFNGPNSTSIYIPKEMILKEYITPSITVLFDPDPDWMDSDDNWVNNKRFTKVLFECCNLTPQEYFDVMVLHINDTFDRPKCSHPECDSYLNWKCFTQGYSHCGNWIDRDEIFCSYSCNASYYASKGVVGVTTWDSNQIRINSIKSRYTTFINQGDPTDECYFYIATSSDGRFKYGITDYQYDFGWHKEDYVNRKIILKSTRINIASIERDIKLILNNHIEYLDYKDVRKFMDAYKSVVPKYQ